MMKKEDANSLRSPSFRENSPKRNVQAKSIGCMAGIFNLIYKYNNRPGKFLTFGKKQEKNAVSSSSQQDNTLVAKTNNLTRFSCDVPRSPTLPAEIRLPNTTPPVMGNSHDAEATALRAESAADQRRKLIEALEKCDEDLNALKKIIDVVKSSVAAGAEDNYYNVNDGDKGSTCKKSDTQRLELNGDLQPSPVSVLDDLTHSSALIGSYSRRYTNVGRGIEQQKQKQKKKPGEEIANVVFFEKMTSESIYHAKSEGSTIISPNLWASKAMIESVNEVCRDMAWGERREIGRIGLNLQDYICRDLIEEVVRDLLGSFNCMYSLPFEACKRSLRF